MCCFINKILPVKLPWRSKRHHSLKYFYTLEQRSWVVRTKVFPSVILETILRRRKKTQRKHLCLLEVIMFLVRSNLKKVSLKTEAGINQKHHYSFRRSLERFLWLKVYKHFKPKSPKKSLKGCGLRIINIYTPTSSATPPKSSIQLSSMMHEKQNRKILKESLSNSISIFFGR